MISPAMCGALLFIKFAKAMASFIIKVLVYKNTCFTHPGCTICFYKNFSFSDIPQVKLQRCA